MCELALGQTVLSQDGRQGIIRFIGSTSFAKGEWIGLELVGSNGKNDGSVNGQRYFECQPGFGIFIRAASIIEILDQRPTATKDNPSTKSSNGRPIKPRPSTALLGSTTHKRQSLLGKPPVHAIPASRFSSRSPTKSPTKQTTSSPSSGESTPRTTTPTTSAPISNTRTKTRLSTKPRASMAPPPSRPPPSRGARQSTSGAPQFSRLRTQQASSNGLSSRTPNGPNLTSGRETNGLEARESDETPLSSSIDEKEEEISMNNGERHTMPSQEPMTSTRPGRQSPKENVVRRATISSQASTARSIGLALSDTSAMSKREIEQLTAKIRALERKRQGDRERLNSLDAVQADKDRFEGIIHKLQTKFQNSQQEITDLRNKCSEVESRAKGIEDQSIDYDTELEMARLDKEMAEEKAEEFESELIALKARVEELELETEVLREENQELSSVTSTDERSSTSWMHTEREKERLREALVKLRDSAQQAESDHRARIKELEADVVDSEKLKGKHTEVMEKLLREERANRHLKEQLEAAESQEEINLDLEMQKESYRKQAEELQGQIEVLQDEAEINDELDHMHRENEKELEALLDTKQAQLVELEREKHQQARTLEDLDIILKKYRSTVSDLQKDINQLRESRNLTEVEANEMQIKSRAIMDLNLKLQNSAAKAQLKAIDVELGRMNAEESAQHLSMIQSFLPQTFETEKNPVLAFLCFKRIRSKSSLVQSVLQEQARDLVETTNENVFPVFDVLDKLIWISSCCSRFVDFISGCSVDEFASFANAVYELEPVERAMNSWIEVLRRNEIKKPEGAEELQRMIAILSDMVEKLIPSNLQNRASEIMASTARVEGYCESVAFEFGSIKRQLLERTTTTDENTKDLQHFCNKMEQFGTRSRTNKYIASKVYNSLQKLVTDGLSLAEPTWLTFHQAEELSQVFSALARKIGEDLWVYINEEGREERPSFAEAQQLMARSGGSFGEQAQGRDFSYDDLIEQFANKINSIHAKVNDMLRHASDLSKAIELERLPAPWVVRAKDLRDRKVLDTETEEQLRRLRNDVQEYVLTLSGKEKRLEEHHIKIQLLESRNKESRNQAAAAQKLSAELQAIQLSRDDLVRDLEKAAEEHKTLLAQLEKDEAELASLRQMRSVSDQCGAVNVQSARDDRIIWRLTEEVNMLKEEVETLQAAVRFLKMEDYRARIPPTSTVTSSHHSWLHVPLLRRLRADGKSRSVATESQDVFNRLIEVARSVKLVALMDPAPARKSSIWRAEKSTPRYEVFKQREELEAWYEWRDDLVARAKATSTLMWRRAMSLKQYRTSFFPQGLKPMKGFDVYGTPRLDSVQILVSPT